jgi:hypothetical protein
VINDFLIHQWSTGVLRALHVVDLEEGIDAVFDVAGGDFHLEFSNRSPLRMSRGCFLSRWRCGIVSDLDSGELAVPRGYESHWMNLMNQFDVPPLTAGPSAWRSQPENTLPWIRDPDTAVLVATLDKAPEPFTIDPEPGASRDKARLILELPVIKTARRLVVPTEYWEYRIESGVSPFQQSGSGGWASINTGQPYVPVGGKGVIRLRQAKRLPGWRTDGVRLRLEASSWSPGVRYPETKIDFEAYDFAEGTWKPITLTADQGAQLAREFIDPESEEIRLKVNVKSGWGMLKMEGDLVRKEKP